MSEQNSPLSIGSLPDRTTNSSLVPAALTWLVWSLFAASVVALIVEYRTGSVSRSAGIVAIDGLSVLMWAVVTFFSGIVHSYSRRYMAGSMHKTVFFVLTFSFTLTVIGLVIAEHIAVFSLSWFVMGLLMAKLIGIIGGWQQAQAAAKVALKYFISSSAILVGALAILWQTTGEVTITGITTAATADTLAGPLLLIASSALVLAAVIQSALVPFHGWLLSSMTAPTPASALMHAGFVNAGGILLTRFAPVITIDSTLMLAVVSVGAASALLGKLLKTVQTDIKGKLGCSTVGQMGFMIMQAGLGFFGAAITHLILHGFYKAYQFLSSGGRVEHAAPSEVTLDQTERRSRVSSIVVTLLTALAGGAFFAVVTGKGATPDTGVLLIFFIVITVLHAARTTVRQASLPDPVRYGAVPVVFFIAIGVYALIFKIVSGFISGLPLVTAPTELTVFHGVIAIIFLGVYIAVETEIYKHSPRLYVMLVNAGRPSSDTILTTTEDYNEY